MSSKKIPPKFDSKAFYSRGHSLLKSLVNLPTAELVKVSKAKKKPHLMKRTISSQNSVIGDPFFEILM